MSNSYNNKTLKFSWVKIYINESTILINQLYFKLKEQMLKLIYYTALISNLIFFPYCIISFWVKCFSCHFKMFQITFKILWLNIFLSNRFSHSKWTAFLLTTASSKLCKNKSLTRPRILKQNDLHDSGNPK